MEDIYSLKLFESVIIRETADTFDGLTVRRVPGGWIFTEWTTSADVSADKNHTRISSVFVPYNDEFLPGRVKKG
jgi:hypothetical protein